MLAYTYQGLVQAENSWCWLVKCRKDNEQYMLYYLPSISIPNIYSHAHSETFQSLCYRCKI
jgi:hypothetical protein